MASLNDIACFVLGGVAAMIFDWSPSKLKKKQPTSIFAPPLFVPDEDPQVLAVEGMINAELFFAARTTENANVLKEITLKHDNLEKHTIVAIVHRWGELCSSGQTNRPEKFVALCNIAYKYQNCLDAELALLLLTAVDRRYNAFPKDLQFMLYRKVSHYASNT